MHARIKGWSIVSLNDIRKNGWMNEWMEGWINVWSNDSI